MPDLLALGAALAAACCFGVSAVLQGVAVGRTDPLRRGLDPLLLVRLLREGAFLAALALNGLGFALHVVALQTLPLFLVQVALGTSLAVTALLSARASGIRLRLPQATGVLGVCSGLALLSVSAQEGGAMPDEGGQLRLSLALGVLVLAVAGLAAARVPGAVGSVLLALLSGAGFGVVAVAARLLPTGLGAAQVFTDTATAILVVAGVVAFLLYATSMQRGSVTLSTAGLVLTQTVVPSLLGIGLLGDAVRPGTAPQALAGFTVAVVAAMVLAREESRGPAVVSPTVV